MSEYIKGYHDGRKDQTEIEKLKAQLQLAEAVCESLEYLPREDSEGILWDYYLLDEDCLNAWRKSKEEK